MKLKEDQWYQLPDTQWCQATWVSDPVGPVLQAYDIDLAGTDGYRNIFDIYVLSDGYTLGVTGLCTWET